MLLSFRPNLEILELSPPNAESPHVTIPLSLIATNACLVAYKARTPDCNCPCTLSEFPPCDVRPHVLTAPSELKAANAASVFAIEVMLFVERKFDTSGGGANDSLSSCITLPFCLRANMFSSLENISTKTLFLSLKMSSIPVPELRSTIVPLDFKHAICVPDAAKDVTPSFISGTLRPLPSFLSHTLTEPLFKRTASSSSDASSCFAIPPIERSMFRVVLKPQKT
mmetsp:Transcript_32726/g.79616  ORF Transcript_32726/g.79616 Transcript_32726/m.79616 type:complete len:225 (+) Transcript_32726:5064-5738(+)